MDEIKRNETPANETKSLRKAVKSQRFKHGSLATIITVVVIVLILLLNTVVTLLEKRVNLRFDLTPNHLFTLTDEAKEYFDKLDEDVTITMLCTREYMENFSVFSDAGYDGGIYEQPIRRLPEILDDLSGNDHITVNYVDTDANPTFLNRYDDINITSYPQMYFIVESARRHKLVDLISLINTDYNETDDYAPNEEVTYYYFTEQPIINAVGYVTDEEVVAATILTGHGEYPENDASFLQMATTVFQNNGLEVTGIDFTTDKIPENTKFLVLVSPERDFTQDEIVKLDDFLQNNKNYGKNLLYFDGGSGDLPNLYAYLADNWGIRVDPNSRVFDADNCITYSSILISEYNSDSDICKELSSNNVKTVVVTPEPIEILWTERDIRTVTPLLKTHDTSFMRSLSDVSQDGTTAAITKKDTDITGTFDIMTLSQKRNQNQPVEESSNVLVSSFGFWTTVNQSTYGNSDLIKKILESMQKKSDPVTIVQKDLMTEAINLSSNQVKGYAFIFSLGFPVVIVIICIIVFVRRKNL